MNKYQKVGVIRDKILAEKYIKTWQEHERHSEVYGGGNR